jgi:hypothetical protein
MESITNTQVEEVARELLRETIERSGWYPDLRPKNREKRIERDVDEMLRMMARAACERLEDPVRGGAR